MTLRTRRLTPADWPALWPILDSPDPEDISHRRFLAILGDQAWGLFGAEVEGNLVGYAAVQDYGPHWRTGDHHRIARFHDLQVAPSERNRGVGRALVEAVVAWAQPRVRHLEWQAHHERAAGFYERLGFRGAPCPQPDYPTFEITFPH